jgi:2-polyprenyl-3-methyl-5-hydroxy-6-metoxy-1,4-benzoquinol methylase
MIKQTVQYYDKHGEEWANYPYDEHRVNGIINDFVDAVKQHTGNQNPDVLDLGCGDGRMADVMVNRHGCTVIGLDASRTMVELARKRGHVTLHGSFLDLTAVNKFDGVFAMSSLQHVRTGELQKALELITKACKNEAVIYMCFPYGSADFVDNKGRYYLRQNESTVKSLVNNHVPAKETDLTTYKTPHEKYDGWINAQVKIRK